MRRRAASPDARGSGRRPVLATLLDEHAEPLDDIVVTMFRDGAAPDVHLHMHGNPWLVERCLSLAVARGLEVREAPATDLWPTPDALEADALARLPDILTLRGVQWLLHQPARLRLAVDELQNLTDAADRTAAIRTLLEHRCIVDWFTTWPRVLLAGLPNVGKSTLANALADRAACITSPTPGTTRDWVEVRTEVDGFPVAWIDTAGLGDSSDELDRTAIERTQALVDEVDAVVWVVDAQQCAEAAYDASQRLARPPDCVVVNKCDDGVDEAALARFLPAPWPTPAVMVSALQRSGLERLGEAVLAALGRTPAALARPAPFADRQTRILADAAGPIDRKAFTEMMLQFTPQGELFANDRLQPGANER